MQKVLVRIHRELSYNDCQFTVNSHITVHKCPEYRELIDVGDNGCKITEHLYEFVIEVKDFTEEQINELRWG